MGLDYYAILCLQRDTNVANIALAYRKYATATHPHRQRYPMFPENPPEGCPNNIDHLPALTREECWKFLNEAYDVLSNPLLRHVYDLYGEEGLKRGTPTPNGYVQPYAYHGDYMKTYADAMGSDSPYADMIDAITQPPPLYTLADGSTGVRLKDPPIELPLHLHLKDIYFGGIKKRTFCRLEFTDETRTRLEMREHLFKIAFRPGVATGCRFTFAAAGDRSLTRSPADITFVVVERPDPVFRREGEHLHWDYDLDLAVSFMGLVVELVTLDCRKMLIPVVEVIDPGYVKCIENEGLPLEHDPSQKGNLYIHFRVNWPTEMTKECKEILAQALKHSACGKS